MKNVTSILNVCVQYQTEVLIADGMSDDGTREIIRQYVQNDHRITMIDNPGLIVPKGLNLAIEKARGDVIVRMDVHTIYAVDYVQKCVECLFQTGAANVGGAPKAIHSNYWQTAISLAYHSPMAVGGSRCHNTEFEGFVDTVFYGCWLKTTLKNIGMFDERFVRNQDDELNLRIVKSGGKIWQSTSIKCWYHPRNSLRSLFKQYAQYGYWKILVIKKHRLPASFRHLVPASFLAIVMLLTVLSYVHVFFLSALLFTLGIYIIFLTFASTVTCFSIDKLRYLQVMPLIFAGFHLGYGYGFLQGTLDVALGVHGQRKSSVLLTRN